MDSILHILNGDSTRQLIEKTNLEGAICVWRDVLSDGPTHIDVGSTEYWKVRTEYMTCAFDISAEDFQANGVSEFEKIQSFTEYQEVVLWFEYDLFCQVNMFALLHWFNQQNRHDVKVSLICVGSEEGHDHLVSLGHIAPERFPELFKRRRIMGTQDFIFASDVYEAWCSADPTDLETYTMLPSNEFPYLADALKNHFKRFPSRQTGLTEIEEEIVNLINSGVQDERHIIGSLLRWQTYHGFGDLQFSQILQRLSPIITKGNKMDLNTEVKKLLQEKRVIDTINRNYYLGGAHVAQWQWDQQKNELASGGD